MSPPHRAVMTDRDVSHPRSVVPISAPAEEISLERAAASIREELAASPYAPLRRVSCVLEGDTLILSGRVPSFYLKQLAQKSAIDHKAVEKIVNRIEVAVS